MPSPKQEPLSVSVTGAVTPTLRTAITTSSTRINQVLPVTPIVTPIRKYTPIDKLARSALYAVRKDISL